MAPGHLVARLQLALHRDEYLHHLQNARRQFIATLQLFDLILKPALQHVDRLIKLLDQRLDLLLTIFAFDRDLTPLDPAYNQTKPWR